MGRIDKGDHGNLLVLATGQGSYGDTLYHTPYCVMEHEAKPPQQLME
jgi:hypothetical protein